MSNSRAMRRKMAGVKGKSARKKDPMKNLRRASLNATRALDGSLKQIADRFGPPAETDPVECVPVDCPPPLEVTDVGELE